MEIRVGYGSRVFFSVLGWGLALAMVLAQTLGFCTVWCTARWRNQPQPPMQPRPTRSPTVGLSNSLRATAMSLIAAFMTNSATLMRHPPWLRWPCRWRSLPLFSRCCHALPLPAGTRCFRPAARPISFADSRFFSCYLLV